MDVFIENYFSNIKLNLDLVDRVSLKKIIDLIVYAHSKNKKIILSGNGGSSTIASHLTIDLINAAKIKSINFNDPTIITCFSNDYGYENWVSKALSCYAESGDVLILVSSSGQSKNMLNAVKKAKNMNVTAVTLTGFSPDNPLRKVGDINLWVDSDQYNIVEMTHHIWLLAVVDYIIKKQKKEGS